MARTKNGRFLAKVRKQNEEFRIFSEKLQRDTQLAAAALEQSIFKLPDDQAAEIIARKAKRSS